VETGQMFHFKRRAGQGRADSPSERKAIVELIQEYLVCSHMPYHFGTTEQYQVDIKI
jgi:hypothetical protein